jgi:hypothetical protein
MTYFSTTSLPHASPPPRPRSNSRITPLGHVPFPTVLLSHCPGIPLFCYPTALLSHYPAFSLSCYPTFLLSHFPAIPLSCYPTFLLSHFPAIPLFCNPTVLLSHWPLYSSLITPSCRLFRVPLSCCPTALYLPASSPKLLTVLWPTVPLPSGHYLYLFLTVISAFLFFLPPSVEHSSYCSCFGSMFTVCASLVQSTEPNFTKQSYLSQTNPDLEEPVTYMYCSHFLRKKRKIHSSLHEYMQFFAKRLTFSATFSDSLKQK